MGYPGGATGGESRLRSKAATSPTSASVRGRLLREPPRGLAGNVPDMSKELETGRLSPPTPVTGGMETEVLQGSTAIRHVDRK